MSVSDAAPDPRDIRPLVPLSAPSDWGLYAFLAVLGIGGVALFHALSDSREEQRTPTTIAAPQSDGTRIASPPPIGLPPRFLETPADEPVRVSPALQRPALSRPVAYKRIPLSPPSPATVPPLPMERPSEPASQSRVVFEQRGSATTAAASPQTIQTEGAGERVSASRFVNPSRTIPLGTVIPAVLETALDSTRTGAVRALVQRDMHGFDGTRVLIPRGTRLYGEYEADLQGGQNRASVMWTRLLRPDGVTMNLASPASDPLGRAGVKGKVDSKFFQRFGGAILQSVLDIGVGLAVREASDGVIVALPGSTQNVRVQQSEQVRPTLKVKHGTSVSVFVARDLDFSNVD